MKHKFFKSRAFFTTISALFIVSPLAGFLVACDANDISDMSALISSENNNQHHNQNQNNIETENQTNNQSSNNNSTSSNQNTNNQDTNSNSSNSNNSHTNQNTPNNQNSHNNQNSNNYPSDKIDPIAPPSSDSKWTDSSNLQSFGTLYPTAESISQTKQLAKSEAIVLEQFANIVPSFLITEKNYMDYIYMSNEKAKSLSTSKLVAKSTEFTDTTVTIYFGNDTNAKQNSIKVTGFNKISLTNSVISNLVIKTVLNLPTNLDKYGAKSLNKKELFNKLVSVKKEYKKIVQIIENDTDVGTVDGADIKIKFKINNQTEEHKLSGLSQNINDLPYDASHVKVVGTKQGTDDAIRNSYISAPKVLNDLLKGGLNGRKPQLEQNQGKEAFELLEKHYQLEGIPTHIHNLAVTQKELVSYGSYDTNSFFGYFYRGYGDPSMFNGQLKAKIRLTLSSGTQVTLFLENFNITKYNSDYKNTEKKYSDSFYVLPQNKIGVYYDKLTTENFTKLFNIYSSDNQLKDQTNLKNKIKITNIKKLEADPNKHSIESWSNPEGYEVSFAYEDTIDTKSVRENNKWILKDIPFEVDKISEDIKFDSTKAEDTSKDPILHSFLSPGSGKSKPQFRVKKGYMPYNGTDNAVNETMNAISVNNVTEKNLLPLLVQDDGHKNIDKGWFHKLQQRYVVSIAELQKPSDKTSNTIKFKFGYINRYDVTKQYKDRDFREVTLLEDELSWYIDTEAKINDPVNIKVTASNQPETKTIRELLVGNDKKWYEKYYSLNQKLDDKTTLSLGYAGGLVIDNKNGMLYVPVDAKGDYGGRYTNISSDILYGLKFKADSSTAKLTSPHTSIKTLDEVFKNSKKDVVLYDLSSKTWTYKDAMIQNQFDKLWSLSDNKKAIETIQSRDYFNRLDSTDFASENKIKFNVPYIYLTDQHNFYYDVLGGGNTDRAIWEKIKYPLEFEINWNDVKKDVDNNKKHTQDIKLKLSTGISTSALGDSYNIDYKVYDESIIFNAEKLANDQIKFSIGFKNNKQIFTNYRNVDFNNLHGIYLGTADNIMDFIYKSKNEDSFKKESLIEFNRTNPLASDGGAGVAIVPTEKFDANKPFENIKTSNLTTNVNKNYKINEGYIPKVQGLNRRIDVKNSVFDDAKRRTFMAGGSWTMLSKVMPNDKNDLRFYVITNQHVVSEHHTGKLLDSVTRDLYIPPLPENNYRRDIKAGGIHLDHFWLGGWRNTGEVVNRYGFVDENNKPYADGIDAAIMILDLNDVFNFIKATTTDKTISLALYNYFNAWMDMKPLQISRVFDQQPPTHGKEVIMGAYLQGYPGKEFISQKINKLEVNRGQKGTMTFSLAVDKSNVFPSAFYKGASGTSLISEDGKLMGLIYGAGLAGGFKDSSMVPLSTPMFDYIGSSQDKIGDHYGSDKLGYSFYQVLMHHILNEPNKYEMINIF